MSLNSAFTGIKQERLITGFKLKCEDTSKKSTFFISGISSTKVEKGSK